MVDLWLLDNAEASLTIARIGRNSSLFWPLAHNKKPDFQIPRKQLIVRHVVVCQSKLFETFSLTSLSLLLNLDHITENIKREVEKDAEYAKLLMQLRPQLQQVTAAELLSRPA